MKRIEHTTLCSHPGDATDVKCVDYSSAAGDYVSPPPLIWLVSGLVGAARFLWCIFRKLVPLCLLIAAALCTHPLRSFAFLGGGIVWALTLWALDEQFRLAMGGGNKKLVGLHMQHTDRNVRIAASFNYSPYDKTPWLFTGDLLTLYPFLAFRINLPDNYYVRRWVAVPRADGPSAGFYGDQQLVEPEKEKTEEEEEEFVAIDIALPEGGLKPGKQFYVVLHGLSGGSREPYVLDFVKRAVHERGCGVCVVVARGLMETPLATDSMFSGARISDVHAILALLRGALAELGGPIHIGLVGYSMGGIIASNYAAVMGQKSLADSFVSMSGSLDTSANMQFLHSRRTWQPLLCHSVKDGFVMPKRFARRLFDRKVPLLDACLVRDIVEFDTVVMTSYHGYQCVEDYYGDMSAGKRDKIKNLAHPLLVVHALDDPIMLFPDIAAVNDSDNIFFLGTESGGHVGWPTGWLPNKQQWQWMSDTALKFLAASSA
jgi:predicted alpha/beta-fold hydrolase